MRACVRGAVALAAALACPAALAQGGPLGETTRDEVGQAERRELTFIAFFLTRVEATNVAPVNDLLQGQTIGRLFGPNSTQTGPTVASFAEQRFIPFIIYEPAILDGKARLRAAFQIRFTAGDSSYGSGGNQGGAINASQLNLQTQNLEVELDLPWPGWRVNAGLQRMYDNARDPYRTLAGTLTLTGERLALWGADAMGISVNGVAGPQRIRAGAYQLYENRILLDDDVTLFEAMTDRYLGGGWTLGAQARYLRDRSSGRGGVSVLSQGPNSRLAEFNGAYRFPLGGSTHRSDLFWVGLDASRNPELGAGRWGGSGFVVGSFGQTRTRRPDGTFAPVANIAGVTANARAGFRYGTTRNDAVIAEAVYSTGDPDGIADGFFSGVITGNTYGAPGAVYATSGTYLLFPHATISARYYGAVQDLSNMGYGLAAATLNASRDLVPNVLTAKLGAGVGFSNVAPPNGGRFIGAELNAMLSYRVAVLMNVEAHAAYLKLGDFFDGDGVVEDGGGRPADPWTAFLAFKWLMF